MESGPNEKKMKQGLIRIVMYCDGFKRHLAKDHQSEIQAWVDHGVGVACLHFGVEVEPEHLGAQFLDWIGGYFEIGWSVNPHWTADLRTFLSIQSLEGCSHSLFWMNGIIICAFSLK